jgi:hypothetical protein
VHRTHLRHDYLLCQIVRLSFVFDECVLRARCWRCFYGSAPGNRFSSLLVMECLRARVFCIHGRASCTAFPVMSFYDVFVGCCTKSSLCLFYLSYIYK